MSYSTLWAKTKLTRRLADQYLCTHGHMLKWKNHRENILEVGCADGSITRNILFPYVKNHIEKIIAVDVLDGMINHAKRENEIEEIDFQIMDAMDETQVENKAGQYDHIFSFYVAHWIPDTRSLIDGFYKMLKSEGQLFMTIMLSHPIHESYRKHYREGAWSEFLGKDKYMADYTEDPMQHIRKIAEDVGFKVELCSREQSEEVTTEFSDFIRALVLMYKHLDCIPEELQEDYIQDHIMNCNEFSEYIGEPSIYSVPYDSLVFIASKNKQY